MPPWLRPPDGRTSAGPDCPGGRARSSPFPMFNPSMYRLYRCGEHGKQMIASGMSQMISGSRNRARYRSTCSLVRLQKFSPSSPQRKKVPYTTSSISDKPRFGCSGMTFPSSLRTRQTFFLGPGPDSVNQATNHRLFRFQCVFRLWLCGHTFPVPQGRRASCSIYSCRSSPILPRFELRVVFFFQPVFCGGVPPAAR